MIAQRLRNALVAACWLAAQACAQAAPIRVCTSDVPYPPFMYPDREGGIQWLLRNGAERTGLQLEMHAIPIKRCLADMASGRMDARIAGSNAITRASLRFPLKGNAPDPERSLGIAREMAFRIKDSKADWDGHQFSNLSGAILMQPGFAATEQMLKGLHVQLDSGGKTLESNLGKLLAGRGSIAIGFDFYAPLILSRPEFAGKVDVLPIPIRESVYYLAVAPEYYQEHGSDVERLWAAITELKRSPAYEAFKQSVIAEDQGSRK